MRKLAVAIALVFPLTMAAPAASATPTPALSSSVSATYSTVDSVVLSTFEANLVAGSIVHGQLRGCPSSG